MRTAIERGAHTKQSKYIRRFGFDASPLLNRITDRHGEGPDIPRLVEPCPGSPERMGEDPLLRSLQPWPRRGSNWTTRRISLPRLRR